MACRRTLRNVRISEPRPDDFEDDPWNETWYWWSKFHERLEWEKRVGVVLELSADLPSQRVIDRWLGEPVKAIVIPTHLFHNNKKGYVNIALCIIEHVTVAFIYFVIDLYYPDQK